MAFTPGLLFTSPYSWAVVLLAIVSVLFISTSFLTYYANKVGNTEAMELLRRFALFWSGPTLLASVIVFITLRAHNAWHFGQMIDVSWMFIASLLFFCNCCLFYRPASGAGDSVYYGYVAVWIRIFWLWSIPYALSAVPIFDDSCQRYQLTVGTFACGCVHHKSLSFNSSLILFNALFSL